MKLILLAGVAAAFLVGLVKRCDPGARHSIYYSTKGRRS